jgi:hypothetical protein
MRRQEFAIGFFRGTGRKQYMDSMPYYSLSEILPFLRHTAPGLRPEHTTFPAFWSSRSTRRIISRPTPGQARSKSARVIFPGKASSAVWTGAPFALHRVLTCPTPVVLQTCRSDQLTLWKIVPLSSITNTFGALPPTPSQPGIFSLWGSCLSSLGHLLGPADDRLRQLDGLLVFLLGHGLGEAGVPSLECIAW